MSTPFFAQLQHDGLIALILLLAAGAVGSIVYQVVFRLLRNVARRGDGTFTLILGRAAGPCRVIFPLALALGALPNVALPDREKVPAEHALGLVIIAAIAWVIVAVVQLISDIVKRRYRLDAEDNLHARQIETRLDILTRAAITIVLFVAVASALMTFPSIRAIGATLLASAGLIGIMAGFASRPIFENLVAGIQIALTQPIRIDDVVIVESEYGRVEKIGATYIVVRLWDWRRMVVPLTYFIDKPFQNWTYTTANLIGSVMLYLDYSVPIEALRVQVPKILAETPLWDGKVVNVALTDARENSIEVRVLVSARDSSSLFDLRCYVREHLIAFVRDEYPSGFTSTRVVLDRDDAPAKPIPEAAAANAPDRVPALR